MTVHSFRIDSCIAGYGGWAVQLSFEANERKVIK